MTHNKTFIPNSPQDERDRQYAYVSIRGRGPSKQIGNVLGMDSSREWSEGDQMLFRLNGEPRLKPDGTALLYNHTAWSLHSPLDQHEDAAQHIDWLLDMFEPKQAKLNILAKTHTLTIVIVGYAYQAFGLELSPITMQRIAKLGFGTWIDAYPQGDLREILLDALLPGSSK